MKEHAPTQKVIDEVVAYGSTVPYDASATVTPRDSLDPLALFDGLPQYTHHRFDAAVPEQQPDLEVFFKEGSESEEVVQRVLAVTASYCRGIPRGCSGIIRRGPTGHSLRELRGLENWLTASPIVGWGAITLNVPPLARDGDKTDVRLVVETHDALLQPTAEMLTRAHVPESMYRLKAYRPFSNQ